MRNTPDLASILKLKEKTSLPVLFDPSHSCGDRKFVKPIALAALFFGAGGLLVETTKNPNGVKCDAKQMLDKDEFENLIEEIIIMKK